ncbi:hypothetical protein PROFUN_11984 [Planoprotostelium fungivorum]|uniref:Sacsin/Nov domain-containing protein n=1 Tax=Planoprotostelium fungivorum TaxID=1890364 RepID=A0A2P6N8V0_9EUKA|nr:hypothetical protein PROFUN_11984 [Planoprotostelium fungivorum]
MTTALEEAKRRARESSSKEEKVEVNQRHLIDKILARYSAEHVVYRELMQNSDDAGAKSVQLRFYTENLPVPGSKMDITTKISKIVFRNDGIPFRSEDWQRLKKIAEGNPDEQKIGAFGVGFYSLFSVCEDPFIASGRENMAFFWDKDQLYTKRGTQDDTREGDNTWTSFFMELRKSEKMPELNKFGQFLARSLSFTTNLQEIVVFFNEVILLRLEKKKQSATPLPISKSFPRTSPNKIFELKTVEIIPIHLKLLQIDTTKSMQFGEPPPLHDLSVFLRIASANIQSRVPPKMGAEMERTNKKKPPVNTSIQMMFTSRDEKEASSTENPIISDLIPFPHQGRVFIGFPTHQTTGLSSHVAGRFIPTVERENIDFVDRMLSVWNHELLYMGGLLARIIYEEEMNKIDVKYKEVVPPASFSPITPAEMEAIDSVKEIFEERAIHNMQSFHVRDSTPSPLVARDIRAGFFTEFPIITLLSSQGMMPANLLRAFPDEPIRPFIKKTPVVSIRMTKACTDLLAFYEQQKVISKITYQDILGELQSRVFNEQEMVAFLKWFIAERKNRNGSPIVEWSKHFQNSALFQIGDKPTPMSQLRYYVNPKIIPPNDVPVPPTTLPYSISKHFKAEELHYIHDWGELSLSEWSAYVSELPQLDTPTFSEKVLGVISRASNSVHQQEWNKALSHFKNKRCIVTNKGMKLPGESYFNNVNLFEDLPIVAFDPKMVPNKMLEVLGVRKHVDLQLLFERMVVGGSWDHFALLKYLSGVYKDGLLDQREMGRLKVTPIFPGRSQSPQEMSERQTQNANANANNTKEISGSHQKYEASKLYAPNEIFWNLGFPIIEWKGKFNRNSDEAKFLIALGLKMHPILEDLLVLAGKDATRNNAVQYLIQHFKEYQDQYVAKNVTHPIIPIGDGKKAEIPAVRTLTHPYTEISKNCFSDSDAAVMDFPVVTSEFRNSVAPLGVKSNPDADQLVQRLTQNPPSDQNQATKVFQYLAARQGEFKKNHWSRLSTLAFIPVQTEGHVKRYSPSTCYFSNPDRQQSDNFFTYVNFGEIANQFLRTCGVKDEPSPSELASILVTSARDYYSNVGYDRYLAVLRMISTNLQSITQVPKLLDNMKKSPFLLGIRRTEDHNEMEEGQDKPVMEHYELAVARDICLVDNTLLRQIFSPLCAPMEQVLEDLYEALGSKWMNTLVEEKYEPKGQPAIGKRSEDVRKLIIQRASLLLHDQIGKNMNHTIKWLLNDLQFAEVPSIEIKRTFKPTNQVKSQTMTACAVNYTQGGWYFLVAREGELDHYDVALALSRIMLKKSKPHLPILWTTILQSSLAQLQRRGFPVERILDTERLARKAAAQEREKRELSESKMTAQEEMNLVSQLGAQFPNVDNDRLKKMLREENSNHAEKVAGKLRQEGRSRSASVEKKPTPTAAAAIAPPQEPKKSSFFSYIKKSFWDGPESVGASGPVGGGTPHPGHLQQQMAQSQSQSQKPVQDPKVSEEMMRRSLQQAIAACQGNESSTISATKQVQEMATSYCDVKPGHQLQFVSKIGDIKIFLDKDLSVEQIMSDHQKDIHLFSDLLLIVSEIYRLPTEAIHIYVDKKSDTIAFNRSTSLFFNLKFFVSLDHAKEKDKALIYWFMTTAHELAHNFEDAHNAQHEYYFSSFAEEYLPGLISRLGK